MSRRETSRLRRLGNDTLVLGLAMLAVAAVAVAISYRAQNGLPWITTYRVDVRVPDAAKLLKNADVRIGGARVGQVLRITAEPGGKDHPPYSTLELALRPDVGPLPAGTTAEVRLASVLGGKFLDLVPGRAGGATVADGGTLPLADARPAIDTDEALLVFQPSSRRAVRRLIGELGNAFAGRGASLNEAFAATASTLPAATRVLRVLADPDTDLAGFLRGARAAAEAIEPVADELGASFGDGAATLEALDDPALDEVLDAAPGSVASATRAVEELSPVLDDASAVVRALRPAGDVLPASLAEIDDTVRAAAPVASRLGALGPAIDKALRSVERLSEDPAATNAIRALGGNDLATFGGSAFIGLGAILQTTGEAQLRCSAAALWMRNLASIASEGDSGGNWLRMVPVFGFSQISHSATPSADLHVNPYPVEDARQCESGNETYADGQAIGNPPGLQPRTVDVPTREEPGR